MLFAGQLTTEEGPSRRTPARKEIAEPTGSRCGGRLWDADPSLGVVPAPVLGNLAPPQTRRCDAAAGPTGTVPLPGPAVYDRFQVVARSSLRGSAGANRETP